MARAKKTPEQPRTRARPYCITGGPGIQEGSYKNECNHD
nr:MAG TPA: hypothetical protein [Caudoviricetes sp.]